MIAAWPGEQLSVAVDGDQFLTALISRNGRSVHQGIWSHSTLLSCLQYNALHAELALASLLARKGAAPSALEGLSLTRLKPTGYVKLNERYCEAVRAPPKRR